MASAPSTRLRPTRLRCEYRDNPLGIDAPQPRLSWLLEPVDPAARAQRQTRYQVLVATQRAVLDEDHGDAWDSGRVRSADSIGVAYAGKPLASNQRVFWKVRVWDDDGRASPWSDPATWTAGLLSDHEWHAHWIAANPAASGPQALPLLRRSFALEKPVARALAYVCGLGHFELRVNGTKAGDDVLEPGWTNYARTCLYAVHDVTASLVQGENVLGVMLGNGMYNVTGGRYAKFKGSFGPPKLLLQLMIDFADGTSTTVVTDGAWQAAPGPITFSCIYGGEDYDARLARAGWDAPGFDAAGWNAAAEVGGPGGRLVAQSSPPVRVMRSLKPVRVTRPDAGVYVYDFGQNFAGWTQLTVGGPAASSVTLVTGELLDEHGRVTQKNTGRPVTFTYTLSGRGTEDWRPRFSYTGFRHVEARTDGAAVPIDLEGEFLHAAAPAVGEFACSKPLFNQIHTLIHAAIASNLQSVLTDCPHREKLGWLEQTHLMAPSIMWNFDVAAFYRKLSADVRDAQHENGLVPTIAPQYTTFKPPWDVFNDSPEWGSACVLSPWHAYQRYGDRQILADNYDSMGRYIAYLAGRANGDIVDYGLGDWYDIGPGDPGFTKLVSPALTATAVYYHDVIVLGRVASLLDQPGDAERYAAQARRIRVAFNDRFFDTKARRYDRGSQTACAMPLVLGLVEHDWREDVLERLIRSIRQHGDHVTAGDIGFFFVLRALADAGRSDVIFDLLSRTDPPSYGAQLQRGATALTEAWDANSNKSQNHLMLGHADSWFFEHLAGIQFDLSRPPAERIAIRPSPVGDVAWARASCDSVLGPISSHWERQGQTIRLIVSVPPSATALVSVPTSDPASVREGGTSLERAAGVRLSRATAPGAAICEIGSGRYVFEARYGSTRRG